MPQFSPYIFDRDAITNSQHVKKNVSNVNKHTHVHIHICVCVIISINKVATYSNVLKCTIGATQN